MSETRIYSAKNIITMNNYRATASHVAVRDGRILGVGDLKELETWGDYVLDDRYADKVLLPGFVEVTAICLKRPCGPTIMPDSLTVSTRLE